MKKGLVFLFLCVMALSAYAVPARRGWQTRTQADGTTVEIQQFGDEFYHYMINRNGKQVREVNGMYVEVGDAPAPDIVKARRAKGVARRQRRAIGTTPNLAPKGIVVLVNFSDQSMQSTHTNATFDELCNSANCTVNSGYPSAREYFKSQSNGAYAPQFDVYGPVTLSRTLSYYGKDKPDSNDGDDQHATDAVVEGCILADQQFNINWADYDSDNDGYVDFVYVIYAGMGQADGGAANTIWPHNWEVSKAISSGYCTYTSSQCTLGGKTINNYAMSAEMSGTAFGGIGTLCHEFGHVMGLPDLYDTSYTTNYENCLTPNDWNIMDGGSYNGDGHCPPNYDPWQKDFFGWHTPVNLGSAGQNLTLYANGTENYQAYQITTSGSYMSPTASGVRYYIENRQSVGWDAPLDGHGMLIWMVNFNSSKWTSNEVNKTANNVYYTIVSASGTKIGWDGNNDNGPKNTYPGSKNVTSYTGISGKPLLNIAENNKVVTLTYIEEPTNGTSTGSTTPDSVSSISVAEALQIGYSLTSDDVFAYSTDTFTIVGYVSYLVPASSNYEVNGSQTFWITDEKGSTAHTNAEGALRVYFGLPNQEAQVGDKVQVVGPIMKATLSSGGVQVDTKSYATVTILESGTTTDPGTGTTPETGSIIQVGDFYYEIQDYGYGAFAELVRVPGTTGYSSYTNLSGDITIPGSITYNGISYQVRAIEYEALNGSGISSVTVGEGVEYIYNFAFMDCSSLTTVTLPSTIVHMGNQVFGWSGLKTLTINATTPPSHGEREYCLMDASYVEHIYVPASSVAAYKADTVWANHASIIEAIPSGTTTDSTGTGTIPETGSIIQVGDFYYEIKDYGYGAFAELVKLPGSAEFVSYTNLSGDITIPGSITYNGAVYPVNGVGYMSLTGSSAITSVTIGEGVGYIHNFAFMNCSSLTTATLPSTVTSMGNQVFGWSGLKTITINAITPPYVLSDEDPFMDASYVEHIYVPASSVDAYKAASVWSNHASIIEAIPSGTSTDSTSTAPTAMDLLNAGFNPRANAVLALYFDVAPCNDVVLAGSYATDSAGGWIMEPDQLAHFTRVEGFDGWYAAEVPYANTSITVKPVQLMSDGSFNWNYQAGDADAWIYKGGDQLSISSSYAGEADVTIPSLGAYIYELAYWRNHVDPCPVEHTYHILLYPPACDSVVPAIRGVFNDWNITPMNPAQTPDGRKAYSYDIVGKESDYLTFADAADASNVILRYRSSTDDWSDLGAYVLPAAQEDTTLIYDFSNSERFRWRNCPEDSAATEPVTHNYTIYLMAPQCETVEPGIYGELNNWEGTPMTLTSLGDRNAYVGQVTAAEGSTFMFSDVKMGGDNGILYFDTASNEWTYLEDITLPQASSDTTLFFDFSSMEAYQWADCPKNIKLYTVILIAPECDSVTPAIIGTFDGWKGTPMYEASYGQQKAYMYQVSDEPGSAFKFFDAVRGWANEIQYYDSISGWLGMPNYEFPNIEADTATLVYDLSDASMYCWALCKPAEPVYHHVVLTSNNPNFGAVYGDTVLTWPDSIVTIGATAAEGYVFSKWADGNMDNPRRVIVTTDTAFMAIFKLFKYTITVATNGPTMGTVMGGGTYVPGEQVTIMATPYKGCEFVEWSNGSRVNPLSFRAYADTMYTAVFRQKEIPAPVICSDTMFFTAADTTLLAVRIYSPEQILPYDRFVIAPIDNHTVMGAQNASYRDSVAYVKGMNISQVAVVTAVPHDSLFRLETAEGYLTPGNEARNALYADSVGADWILTKYDSVVIPQTVHYDQRMLLYNETAARYSAYRQLTSIDRRQTSIFKLLAPRVEPVVPVVITIDSTAWQEPEPVVDSITAEVVPQDTVAVITTPHVDYVYSFTLFIWADEAHTQVLLIITYDSEGNQLSVTRPNAVRRIATANADISFEVGDLKPNIEYHYTLVACEDDGSILTSLNSSFVTTAEPAPSNIGNLSGAQGEIIKFIHNGQLFILRDGKLYNALGVQVK